MPRPPSGELRATRDGFSARVRVGDDRETFAIALTDKDAARERCNALADIASRLERAGRLGEASKLLTLAGKARPGKAWEAIITAIDAVCTPGATTAIDPSAPVVTFAAFAEDWTSGRLHARHPDHVPKKDSTRDEESLRLHINPVIGPEPISGIELAHAEQVLAALPSTLAPRTRKLIAQCMRRVLSLAVYPGRHLAANPIPREWMPKIPKSANRAKTFLYPAEDAMLLGCTAIPIERRLAYGILIREGMRAAELEGLHFRDLDLERGRIRLDKNKTNDPRAWALDPSVARTLAWWKAHRDAEDHDLVIGLDLGDGAWWLRGDEGWTPGDKTKRRGDLRSAGVTRAELFESTPTRQPVRLHDLRASFVTIALATGKTEQWVSDRTGHRSSQMLAAYSRQARTWDELGLGVLAPLDSLLPEFVERRLPLVLPPNQSRFRDLNSRPTVYETVALPLS